MSGDLGCFVLTYPSGEEMRKGDKVLVNETERAIVEAVLAPGTHSAEDYYVEDTGGFVLRYDDGQIEVWAKVEKELAFIGRAT